MGVPAPYYDHAGITIYHGDCREILPSLAGVGCFLTREYHHLELHAFCIHLKPAHQMDNIAHHQRKGCSSLRYVA